jgi:hypothetical protein
MHKLLTVISLLIEDETDIYHDVNAYCFSR